ncbi:MAG: GAF domain-containing protein [candidate division Zixibacteria bacterium]|nr:GAF domain-containing protein [candidate division Zixibacteria bacterium]
MIFPMADLVVTLLLLCALVLIARFKDQIRADDTESYRYISGGLAILALVALSRVYSALGVFDQVAFVSDPLFYRLLSWIGIITGATFLVSGISHWFPLARANRKYDRKRIQRLELLKRLEQLVRVEGRLASVLSKSLEYMVDLYDLSFGAVYGFSPQTSVTGFVSASGDADAVLDDLKRIRFDEGLLQCGSDENRAAAPGCIGRLPSGLNPPALMLPLVAEGNVLGMFLLWTHKDDRCQDEARVNLKIAVDIIARQTALDSHLLADDRRLKQQLWRESVAGAIDHRKDIGEIVTGLARTVTELVPADLVSMVIADERYARRLSVGENGTLLNEKISDVRTLGGYIRRVLETGLPEVIDDVETMLGIDPDQLLARSNVRSWVAMPLKQGGKVKGVFVVASRQPGRYSAEDKESIRSIVPLLQNIVTEEIGRIDINRRERSVQVVDTFLADVARGCDLQKLFERATDLLSTELKCSCVRVSTFDYDGAFLSSRALTVQHPVQPTTPRDGHMVLSLMPYHRLVHDTGRMMLINQENTDKKISEAEAHQAFTSDVKSALLVPVKVGDRVPALIGLADTRVWDRYQYRDADLSLVTSIASVLGVAIGFNLSRKAGAADYRTESAASGDARLRSRVRSSLSGIMGSLEVIRSQQQPTGETLTRYLSIIDRSAQRINECFVGDAPKP